MFLQVDGKAGIRAQEPGRRWSRAARAGTIKAKEVSGRRLLLLRQCIIRGEAVLGMPEGAFWDGAFVFLILPSLCPFEGSVQIFTIHELH